MSKKKINDFVFVFDVTTKNGDLVVILVYFSKNMTSNLGSGSVKVY